MRPLLSPCAQSYENLQIYVIHFPGTFSPTKRNKPRNYGLTKQASLSSEPQYRKPMPYLDAPYFPCYIGGFQLLDLIITVIKSHMTC